MFGFVLTAVAVSLSGTVAPGPITAATLASGRERRHAGVLVGLGHISVELTLFVLLVNGVGAFMGAPLVRAAIGFVGGLLLLFMGAQLLLSLRRADAAPPASVRRHPYLIGLFLTLANPYFVIWWATVGLTLATEAMSIGMAALALFALLHWCCDIGWLEILSLAGHKGSEAMGNRGQKALFAVCGSALLFFGVKFIYDAGMLTWQA